MLSVPNGTSEAAPRTDAIASRAQPAGPAGLTTGGVPSFTLSVPTRYVHTVNEMANVEDIQCAIDLLAAYLEEAHTRQYGYQDEA